MNDGLSIVFHFHNVEADGVILLALGSFGPSVFLLQRDEDDFAVIVVFRRRERELRVVEKSLLVIWATTGSLCEYRM